MIVKYILVCCFGIKISSGTKLQRTGELFADYLTEATIRGHKTSRGLKSMN